MQLCIAYPTAGNSLFHSDNKLYNKHITYITYSDEIERRSAPASSFKFSYSMPFLIMYAKSIPY